MMQHRFFVSVVYFATMATDQGASVLSSALLQRLPLFLSTLARMKVTVVAPHPLL